MFRRFIRWIFGDEEQETTRALIAELRAEVNVLKIALEEHVESHASAVDTYTNDDGEKIPMAQVISEYLYGKEGDQ